MKKLYKEVPSAPVPKPLYPQPSTMERELIATQARQLKTREQLLELLNCIKQDEMRKMGMGDSFFPFSMSHLTYYCNPNHARKRYTRFEIKKKSGGVRIITAPRTANFKWLLRCVNVMLDAMYVPSCYAMGFTRGRSIVDNAQKHTGQNYVLNIDLKDFFPSIAQARVWGRLQVEPFNFSKDIASVLAGLCAMKDTAEDGATRYVLPQGAPTSPIITNMVCDTLDRRLAGLAKRFGLCYTRYADDITFSSMHNVYHEHGEFLTELKRIIEGQRFAINEAKTRLQKVGARQEVTGLIVSKKVNVSKEYVRDLRNILFIWEHYGIGVARNKFYPRYKANKGHVKKGHPDMVNVIDGKLMYLKMVKGESDPVFQRLYRKFQQLTEQTLPDGKVSPSPQRNDLDGLQDSLDLLLLEMDLDNLIND